MKSFEEWFNENLSEIEMDYIESLPPEDVPLDDDTPDFLQDHAEELDAFAYTKYELGLVSTAEKLIPDRTRDL